MKSSLSMWLGERANRALKLAGVRLVRADSPADRRRMRLIERHGIATVIDIGANAGQYGRRLRDQGYEGEILSYEPLPAPFEQLRRIATQHRSWKTENKAVSNEGGTVVMNVAGNSVSSSLLEMGSRHLDSAPESAVVSTIRVQTISLQEILSPLAGPVMVKADTQGYEYPVLLSAGELLRSVALFELELSLVELYKGQVLFRELDAFLLSQGFSLVSVDDGFFDEQRGELLQMDAIYRNDALPAARNP
jgi:FkbM family methyltransferase